MTDPGISHPIYARLYNLLNRGAEEKVFPPHREYLTADLAGDILDIGIGTGSMIDYYVEARERGDRFTLHAIEPDRHMRQQAIETANAAGLQIDITGDRAERLSYPDDSFDLVICSLVLCSVRDVDKSLSEISRALRPDGEFRFFEHVRSDGLRGSVESALSPIWRPIVAGCHIDRRTGARIADWFEIFGLETFDIGTVDTFPARRFVRGRAKSR